MPDFDLIIVGTGSGNSLPSPANEHQRIAIVEKGTFGGTCINVGCIPTKMFVHTADVARSFSEASRLSLTGELQHVDWKDIQRRVFAERIDPISRSGAAYRAGEETPNITLFEGTARFVGPRTLQIDDGPTITGTDIVLATGGRPRIHPALADVRYRTNEDIMRLDKLPKSLIVVGGGIVAVEFAAMFSGLGTQVTLINRSDKLLRKLDADISEAFTTQAKQQWTNHLGCNITAAEENDDGQITLTLDDGTTVTGEEVLVAMGRVNNSDTLDCEAGGVKTRKDGLIEVDEYGRTCADGVWALGDACNDFELKHVANAEARVVAHNLAHPDDLRKFNHDVVPSGVFAHPQIGVVGLTEQEARETGRPITVKIQKYGDVAYGWAMEDTTGFCKVIADRSTGEILGAHIIGPEASSLIQCFVTAMTFGINARDFAEKQYWPHPALTELVENALLGLDLEN